MEEKLKQVIKNLEANGMKTYLVSTKEEALKMVEDLIPQGATVGVGGSLSLKECGIIELLGSGKYCFLDKYAAGLSADESINVMKKSLTAEYYLSSSNAVTLDGELYNVDGNGNRLAALNYGPDNVIFVIGANKIVKDLTEADYRMRTVAAPKNAKRLCRNTPCAKTGKCVALTRGDLKTYNDGCDSADRICRNYLVLGKQKSDGRIKIILCKEPLGY